MKDNTNRYIIGVILLGFVYLGFLFFAQPEQAANQVPSTFALVGGAIALLKKTADAEKRVETTAAILADKVDTTEKRVETTAAILADKVDQSVAASEQNAHTLATVSKQTAQALEQVKQEVKDNTIVTEATQQIADTTHQMVDGQRTTLLAELRAVRAEVAELKQERAVKQTEQAHADDSTQRIISAIEAGLIPPKEGGG